MKSRTFGIEFEFENEWSEVKKYAIEAIKTIYGPRNYIAKEECFESNFALNKWHIKTEVSGHTEITTPVSSLKDLKKIIKVIDHLKNCGVTSNDDDGIHIHISVKDIDKYHLLSGWLKCEKSMYQIFPKQRKNNDYCYKIIKSKRMEKKPIATIVKNLMDTSEDKHSVFSLNKYEAQKTVEVRICESTLDIKFIETWIKFILKFIDYIKELNPTLIGAYKANHMSWKEITECLELNYEILDVLNQRHKKFKS